MYRSVSGRQTMSAPHGGLKKLEASEMLGLLGPSEKSKKLTDELTLLFYYNSQQKLLLLLQLPCTGARSFKQPDMLS